MKECMKVRRTVELERNQKKKKKYQNSEKDIERVEISTEVA